MDIRKPAVAGTYESSDAYVCVQPSKTLELEIESVVYNQYKNAIQKAVMETLAELGVTSGKISIRDKGAVDCVIQARVETAIMRSQEV